LKKSRIEKEKGKKVRGDGISNIEQGTSNVKVQVRAPFDYRSGHAWCLCGSESIMQNKPNLENGK